MKPGGLSRGRQIKIFDALGDIYGHCKFETKTGFGEAESKKKWVVQKYMERPKIINYRKFDFRVWVVVVSWNPYIVYWYKDLYLRFGSSSYSRDVKNLFAHLTNHTVTKKNHR